MRFCRREEWEHYPLTKRNGPLLGAKKIAKNLGNQDFQGHEIKLLPPIFRISFSFPVRSLNLAYEI